MKSLIGWLFFGAWLFFAASVLVFGTFEAFPALAERAAFLRDVRYYQLTSRYRPDDRLAFVPAPGQLGGHYSTRGDQYLARYGVDVDPVEMTTSYNEYHFRSNSSSPPYDVLVIGDSYIEIGERDDLTLSELLHKESGRSTFNLGRAWYGPDQYVALFEEFAPKLKPQVALFCFFAGNDIDDIRMFAQWQRGGAYYDFPRPDTGVVARYVRAMRDGATLLERRLSDRWPALGTARSWIGALAERTKAWAAHADTSTDVDPDLALVHVGSRLVPMRMSYIDDARTPEQLLASPEWTHLRTLLERFRDVAAEQRIVPVLVYEPTHLETYAGMVSRRSGRDFLRQYRRQHGYESAKRDALAELAKELNIELIDLLPEFRRLARDGTDLYYPFDTHWTPEGRRAAAKVIARALPPPR